MRCVPFFCIGHVVLKNIIKIECILNVLLLYPYGKVRFVSTSQLQINQSCHVTTFVDKAFVVLEVKISKYLQINVFSIIHFNFYSTIFIEELHVYMLVDVSDLSDSNCITF